MIKPRAPLSWHDPLPFGDESLVYFFFSERQGSETEGKRRWERNEGANRQREKGKVRQPENRDRKSRTDTGTWSQTDSARAVREAGKTKGTIPYF